MPAVRLSERSRRPQSSGRLRPVVTGVGIAAAGVVMAVIALRYATGQHERSHAMAAVPAASAGARGRDALALTLSMPFCRVRAGTKVGHKREPG